MPVGSLASIGASHCPSRFCTLAPNTTPAAPAATSPRNTRRPTGTPRSGGVTEPGYDSRNLVDARDSVADVVRVDALDLQQLIARRGRFGLRARVGRGDPRFDPFGHDALGFVDQRGDHVGLRHDAHDVALHEEVALAAAAR